MVPDTATATGTDDAEVMASVDADGSAERLIIADIRDDDAWISIPLSDAVSLPAWE